jgi:hypothetical protein
MGREVKFGIIQSAKVEEILLYAGARRIIVMDHRDEVDRFYQVYPHREDELFGFDADGQKQQTEQELSALGISVGLDGEPDSIVKPKRPYGLAKGLFKVPADFDDPLPDDIIRLFEGE